MIDPVLLNDVFFRLLVAAVLGALIGAERTLARKDAGIRTFALVSLSSALFVIISSFVNEQYLGKVSFDPSRVIASIVSGIGFLGAGIIFMQRNSLKGLTTAAGFWITSAIGVSVGFGYIYIAIFSTLLVILIFTAVWFVEKKLKNISNKYQRAIVEPENFELK